jgi:hypothetical protein
MHRSHRTSRDKLVWHLQGKLIGYSGLVVINQSEYYKGFIGYTGLVVTN